MSNIKHLTSANFVIFGKQQKTLGINLNGNVLVFFKMTGCQNCSTFEPVYGQLATKEHRVMFAVADVSQYRDIVNMSRNTLTPIQAVPSLILYINGRPHAKFNGTKNIPSLESFITKALSTGIDQQTPPFQNQQQFMQQSPNAVPSNMYGGTARPMAPQGYSQQQNSYYPEIGEAPSMRGVIKGTSNNGGYAKINTVEEEDDSKILIPDGIVPYNTPWETEYRRLGDGQ
jgi:thiol-disulfide isomerase/thioredoxin